MVLFTNQIINLFIRFKYFKHIPLTMETFTALIQKEEDMYVANCPETGTTSQGKTIEEVLKNLKEATELYLEEFPIKNKKHPILTTFEVDKIVKA